MKREIAVIDFETDPFKYLEVPKPFVCGFKSATDYKIFEGSDCVFQLVCFLDTLKKPHLIYAHNGGKFDYFFMLQYLENPIKIIGTRIVKCAIGKHELRDSYSLLPMPLAAFQKDDFDYSKLHRDIRANHMPEILAYLRSDCEYLFELVSAFVDRFGVQLTVAGTAIKELAKLHPFDKQNAGHDSFFRPYFFGGRVEHFQLGVMRGKFRCYDVNSMYPYVMSEFAHPTGSRYFQQMGGKIDARGNVVGRADFPVYFAEIECNQKGAFPTRIKNESLNFDVSRGTFFATSHEVRAALDTGRVSDIRLIRAVFPAQTIKFTEFVKVWSRAKIDAQKAGDKKGAIFAKLIMNSAYGKFAQNPDHFYDYFIEDKSDAPPDDSWSIWSVHASGINVWRKPAPVERYFDVATAASITGAARAVLMRALSVAKGLAYCDTDSIICERLDVATDDTKLGAWKLEAKGDELAIAGKKLYALRNSDGSDIAPGKKYKAAHKGALMSVDELFRVAKGETVQWLSDAPSFSLSKGVKFIDRKIKSVDARKKDRKMS